VSRSDPRRWRFAIPLLLVLGQSIATAQAPAPVFQTRSNNPGDNTYFQPSYPVAFVAAPVTEYSVQVCKTGSNCNDSDSAVANCVPNGGVVITAKKGDYETGTDVIGAADPEAGSALYIYLPANGAVVKLFPLPFHDTTNIIDFSPAAGSVVEPSLSEDGTRIYFSYFQDATNQYSTTEYLAKIPWSGADMYWIDIAPLLTNPSANPDTLLVKRLTSRIYKSTNPSLPDSRKQQVADRDKDALNIPFANQTTYSANEYGTVYLHPTEFRTKDGLKLAYASGKRRLDNSNASMNRQNYNFNLHVADLQTDGSLGAVDNQFQYYTTTSALSPSPLREGLAFSYQATTQDARNWHIQGLNSEGRWYPIIGYGSNPELYHLTSFCVAQDAQGVRSDQLVASRYYNVNNQGFGTLWKQDLSTVGKNTYSSATSNGMYIPYQVGSQLLTYNSNSSDYPSPTYGPNLYYGKFTSPRCGGVNELYFSYTPTSANSKLYDNACDRHIYHAYVGLRRSLDPWSPHVLGSGGHYKIVVESGNAYNLLWPVPIVDWATRSGGDLQQQFTASSIINNQYVSPGMPYAQVGTSALWNTDRKPFECRYVGQSVQNPIWFHPWGVNNVNEEHDKITANQDGWTRTTGNPATFCNLPALSEILGIAINVTSNKTDMSYEQGYQIENGNKPLEAKKLLGVYDVRSQTDQSFRTLIPANVPFEFQLLDSSYGLKLTDVRSWHSLKPRERRTDCGGCHQHDANIAPIPFAGTYAATHAPVDFTASTPKVQYAADCSVSVVSDPSPAVAMPEWKQDIWPNLVSFCGSCHQNGGSGAAALNWDAANPDEQSVYSQIANRRFASDKRGALGSQLFWAARGVRTDNRPNTPPAQYSNTSASQKVRWGFYFSPVHASLPSSCANQTPGYADWVLKLGQWIDNGMARDRSQGTSGMKYKSDWYHPTGDLAIISSTCAPRKLRVGWWDDTNQLKSVKVSLNGAVIYQHAAAAPFANGSATFNTTGTIANTDVMTVEVIDMRDNRQIYKKRVDVLKDECGMPQILDDPIPINP
jgi:hypothetical protein